jgi:hypothetical protein
MKCYMADETRVADGSYDWLMVDGLEWEAY